MPADAMPPPVPAARRSDLPAEPLTRGDVPPGVQPRLGRLSWFTSERGRPFMTVTVKCNRCGREHSHWWRGDWPVSAEVTSHQTSPCRKDRRAYWVALDPALMGEHEEKARESGVAFQSWQVAQAERKAAVVSAEVSAEVEVAVIAREPEPALPVPVEALAPAQAPAVRSGSPLAGRVRARLTGR